MQIVPHVPPGLLLQGLSCSHPPDTIGQTQCIEPNDKGSSVSGIGDDTVDTVELLENFQWQFSYGVHNEVKTIFMSVIIQLFAQNPIIQDLLPQLHNAICCPQCNKETCSQLKFSQILHFMRYAYGKFQNIELMKLLLWDVLGHTMLGQQQDVNEFFCSMIA